MSSISLPLKLLVVGGALAGLTMLACGGDDGGGSSGSKDAGTSDAGKHDSGTTTKADSGSVLSNIPQANAGDDCTGATTKVAHCSDSDCSGLLCTTTCGADGTWGQCTSLTSADGGLKIPDGGFNLGLPDGSTFSVKDGSVSVSIGDASVNIPATACPSSLSCSNLGGLSPIKYCSADGLTPPACMSTSDCTSMGLKVAQCAAVPAPLNALLTGTYCLSICQ